MGRRRNGQCTLCGCWIEFGSKGTKCKACKAPRVRAARKALRDERKANREVVLISEEDLEAA